MKCHRQTTSTSIQARCDSRWGSEQSGGAVADETCLNQQNSEAPESFFR